MTLKRSVDTNNIQSVSRWAEPFIEEARDLIANQRGVAPCLMLLYDKGTKTEIINIKVDSQQELGGSLISLAQKAHEMNAEAALFLCEYSQLVRYTTPIQTDTVGDAIKETFPFTGTVSEEYVTEDYLTCLCHIRGPEQDGTYPVNCHLGGKGRITKNMDNDKVCERITLSLIVDDEQKKELANLLGLPGIPFAGGVVIDSHEKVI